MKTYTVWNTVESAIVLEFLSIMNIFEEKRKKLGIFTVVLEVHCVHGQGDPDLDLQPISLVAKAALSFQTCSTDHEQTQTSFSD